MINMDTVKWKRTHEQNVQHVLKFRKSMQAFVRDIKTGKPCVDCGVSYAPHVMQFDHVRGKKEFNLSSVSSHFVAKHRVLAEIEKCEIVCANCHAERTHSRRVKSGSVQKAEDIACAANRKAVHGSASMYSYHRCRCRVCRSGHAARQRAFRASKKAKQPL